MRQRRFHRHLTYANVMASIAVFFALAGTGWAVAAGTVGTAQLRNNAVTRAKIAPAAVGAAQIGGLQVRAQNFGPLTFQEATVTVADKSAGVATATCPGNSKPISGGAYWKDPKNPNNAIEPTATGPFNGLTLSSVRFLADIASVHSVRARGVNNSGSPELFAAQAVCLASR